MTITQIKQALPKLVTQWQTNRKTCTYPGFIDDRIKKLNSLLKKTSSDPIFQAIHEVKAVSLFNNIKVVNNKPDILDIGMITIFSETDERMKIFTQYAHYMDNKTYWQELRYAYQMQDYVKITHKLLAALFLSDREIENS